MPRNQQKMWNLSLYVDLWASPVEQSAVQEQAEVATYWKSKQLLLFCLHTADSVPVLDGRRESCSTKTNSSNCSLEKLAVTAVLPSHGDQYVSTRWQKRILQLEDKQQYLLTVKGNGYCCLSLHGDHNLIWFLFLVYYIIIIFAGW